MKCLHSVISLHKYDTLTFLHFKLVVIIGIIKD